MTDWDEQVREQAKHFQVPETYHRKVEVLLDGLLREEKGQPQKKRWFQKPMLKVVAAVFLVCVFLTGYVLFSETQVVQAGFLETFKQTIFDALGLTEETSARMGIERKQEQAVSKPDLLIELQETVMDTQNIYAVVKVVAPPSVEFTNDMTFDYYGFCRGKNYNAEKLLSGVTDCVLLEVSPTKSNVATFVVSIATDERVREGKPVTVFLKDLITGKTSGEQQTLIEGMWSLNFSVSNVKTKKIVVKGKRYMQYTLLDTQVKVKKLRLLPLGLKLVTNVSMIPTDILNTSDTRITIRLRMLDGSEIPVISTDEAEVTLSSASSISQSEKNGKVFYTLVSQFDYAIPLEQVAGVLIEDCYISLLDAE